MRRLITGLAIGAAIGLFIMRGLAAQSSAWFIVPYVKTTLPGGLVIRTLPLDDDPAMRGAVWDEIEIDGNRALVKVRGANIPDLSSRFTMTTDLRAARDSQRKTIADVDAKVR